MKLFKKKYVFQSIKSKPVLLLLLWLFVLGFNNSMIISSNLTSSIIFVNFNNLQFIAYPLLGVLMDMWFSRLVLMKLCVLATSIGLVINLIYNTLHFVDMEHLILKWFGIILFTIPFSLYRTNVIPLYMDQMIESPSSELSAVIYWHTFVLVVPVMIGETMVTIVTNKSHLFIIQLSLLLVTVYILPCSYSNVPSHLYEDHPQVTNPVKLVYNVLKYSFKKNRNPRHRSAFTFWEEECPSRVDLAKIKYGGIFSEGEVEDVKTLLRIVPILICTCGHMTAVRIDSITAITLNEFFSNLASTNLDALPTRIVFYGIIVLLIIIQQFVLRPLFPSIVPTMLKRMGIGLIFVLISSTMMSLLSFNESDIDHICQEINQTTTVDAKNGTVDNYSTLLYFIPVICDGVSYYLIITSSIEFTVAQSPVHMRGLLIGIWYMFWGIGTMAKFNLHYTLQCQLYYYTAIGVINLIILIVFLIFAKRYKLRMRNTIYNAHQITEDKVMRNIINDKKKYETL